MSKKQPLDKDVAYAREKLLEKEAECRKTGINRGQVSYIIAYKDSEALSYPQVDRACFGGLLEKNSNGISLWAGKGEIVGFISLIIPARGQGVWPNHPNLKEVDRDQWLKWVINDSPWASAFITKSVKEGLKKGLVCNVNVPSNFLIGGLMAVRAVTDNTRKVTVWAELVKHGLDSTYAYLASHFFTPQRKEFQRIPSLIFRGIIYPSAEHMALGSHFFRSKHAMKNFLNGNVVHPRRTFQINTIFSVNGYTIHNIWGRGSSTNRWMLDCPIMGEAKKVFAGWNSNMTMRSLSSSRVTVALRSHHTTYCTPKEKEKLVASITKQFDTIKAG